MTDNEKRAHDLALTLLSSMLDPKVLENAFSEKEAGTYIVHGYDKYLELYNKSLAKFNHDFPENK